MEYRSFFALLVALCFRGVLSQSCSCPYGLLRALQVCGTDGITYQTACALNNAQQGNRALGLKCVGPCPCPVTGSGIGAVCSLIGLWNPPRPGLPLNPPGPPNPPAPPAPSQTAKPPTLPVAGPPAPVNDFIGRPSLPAVQGKRQFVGRRRHFSGGFAVDIHGGGSPGGPPSFGSGPPGFGSGSFGGHSSFSGPSGSGPFGGSSNINSGPFSGPPSFVQHGYLGWSIPRPQICLTDGTTLDCPIRARCAVANPATPGLGIRCWDNCSRCAAAPICPGVSGPSQPTGGVTATPNAGGQDPQGPPEPIPDFVSLTKHVFENEALAQH